MSHFPVLVTGHDIDEQLAPYDENLETAPRREYLDPESVARMATHYAIDPTDLRALAAKMEDWRGVPGGVDADGLYARVRYNACAKWDWYEVGGRWSGFLKLKPDAAPVRQRSVFDAMPPTPDGFADVARKRDVDFDGMRDAAEAEARETWRLYAAAIAGTPGHIPWSVFAARVDAGALSVEDARAAYGAQPWVRAFEAAGELKNRLGWLASVDTFPATEAEYVATARALAVTTYAYVHDEEWHDRGDVGWFGTASNEKPAGIWAAEFAAMLDDLPDDTLLTVVDCHI